MPNPQRGLGALGTAAPLRSSMASRDPGGIKDVPNGGRGPSSTRHRLFLPPRASPTVFDYELADGIVEEIAREFSPRAIVVFGSVARREADDESDLDLRVVMDSELPPPKRTALIYRHFLRCMLPMDVFVLTPDELREELAAGGSFAGEILRTGVVAYGALPRGCDGS